MQFTDITTGQTLSPTDYDQLTCCGQPALIGRATDVLPVHGAVCDKCRCCVTANVGRPATVRHCRLHQT